MSYANRGKNLEELISYINDYYKQRNIALLHKVPTEWSYANGRYFPKRKSIVDFLGIAKGKPIAFDTKECSNTSNFPIANIHNHQMEYLRQFATLGGLAFYLIHLKKASKIFILTQYQLDQFIKQNTRKSIPFHCFWQNCKEVDYLRVDYLSCLEV